MKNPEFLGLFPVKFLTFFLMTIFRKYAQKGPLTFSHASVGQRPDPPY